MSGLISQGVQGIHKGMQQMSQAAGAIAQANTNVNQDVQSLKEADSLSDAILELKTGQIQAEASTKVVAVADETKGHLLDVMA